MNISVMSAGYSNNTLAKKLGIKEGFHLKLVNQPAYYFDLFIDLPDDLQVNLPGKQPKDIIHYFCTSAAELAKKLPLLKQEIKQNGMIWVSWPKKASKVTTDVTEDQVRDTAVKNGLVDVKVCAVNEIWSALKLVIPVKSRTA